MLFSWSDYVLAVATTEEIPIRYRKLRLVQLAQAIVESGRGTSQLFQKAGNPGGLKWRDKIDEGYVEKITHKIWIDTPTEPQGCDWCHWKTAEQAVMGYWRFINRPNSPYQGWEAYDTDPDNYLQHLKDKGYATDPDYVSKIKSVFPEAQSLLDQYQIPSLDLNASDALQKFRVAVMPGHGGRDSGAVNHRLNLREKDYNWREAVGIKNTLEATGHYEVILCRAEDELATLATMQQRANDSLADVCLCLHHNAANGNARGWWLFYVDRKPEFERFIKVMNKQFEGLSFPARNYLYAGQPFAQDWHRRVWSCIRHCTMPTILCESCFIDNDADAIWLRDGGYKQVIEKICSGVQEFSASSSTFISGENQEIKATSDTWLKKDWSKQASELDDTQKAFVPKGKSYLIKQFQESSLEINSGGNALVELGWGAGKWYVFVDHWQLPWTRTHKQSTILISPELSQVDWHDWSSPVSCYFNVGEVTLCQTRRIPTDSNHRQNVIELARRLDEVRKWWGSALLVNSWYRPPAVEREVGGSGANHPFGFAVDLRPARGSVWELQLRFEQEWYNAGKWQGGFGRGANKGFIHLDLNSKLGRRVWNY
jgi:N-acetylmuramoyl-L-alanine amidase